MLFWITILSSLRSLWSAKLRSFLAILGIIMGVGAVISMLSIVEGARREMNTMIGRMGTDVLFVWADFRSAVGRGSSAELTLDDARAVLTNTTTVIRASPVYNASAQLKYMNKNIRASVSGVAPTFFIMRNLTIERGRPFTDTEVSQSARVVVIGPRLAEKLFGTTDPLEQKIKVNNLQFRVVGLLKARGAQGFSNEDDALVTPYTTAQNQIAGRRAVIGSIILQAASTDQLKAAEDDVRRVLRKRHRLKPDAKDDFGVFNQAQVLEMQSQALGIFTIVLGGVGGICLFTGGIGIMNIMLVIVTERTREIGIRKAVGARGRDILTQFLLEATLISVIGGLFGIAGGTGLSLLISALTPLKTVVSPNSVILALSFAAAIGIFFGYYPATRAAKLDPIDALAFE
jgi:putative ABC transport system permease protein